MNRDTKAIEPTSQFHGKDQKDYQGRPWTTPPAGTTTTLTTIYTHSPFTRSRTDSLLPTTSVAPPHHSPPSLTHSTDFPPLFSSPEGLRPSDGDHQCYIPKKCVHKYTGHTKGVQAIEFIPTYGNLLLRCVSFTATSFKKWCRCHHLLLIRSPPTRSYPTPVSPSCSRLPLSLSLALILWQWEPGRQGQGMGRVQREEGAAHLQRTLQRHPLPRLQQRRLQVSWQGQLASSGVEDGSGSVAAAAPPPAACLYCCRITPGVPAPHPP